MIAQRRLFTLPPASGGEHRRDDATVDPFSLPTHYPALSLGLTSHLFQWHQQIMRANLLARRGGGIGSIVGWFIRIVIYDICITGIADILHVSRMVALFIFLGILAVIAFVGYLLKQKMSPGFEED